MNPRIVRKILYPAYRFIKQDKILPKLTELEKNQWLSTDAIREFQWSKLKKLLAYAHEKIPYYRALFSKAGLEPNDINCAEDYRKIPILTKDDIRNHISELTAPDFDRKFLLPNSTGGSTGENLNFYNDLSQGEYSRANTIRCNRWMGVDIADREAWLWGSPFDIAKSEERWNRILSYFMNNLKLSSYDLSEKSLKEYSKKLSKFRPRLITCYPTPMATFADYLLKNGVNTIRPQAVITSAETLFDHQRELIESAFGCRVFNRYGCREFGNIAHECAEHSGLHVIADRLYLEFLDNGRPVNTGETGEIFVTDLDNYGMPFIRYKIGDMGVPSDRKCKCGRGLPLVEKVEGRVFDVVRTPSGQALGGTFWTLLSRAVEGIRQFQVIQTEIEGVTIKIIVDGTFRNESLEYLQKKIAEHCGRDFKVYFQIVDNIPLTKSGKFRFVISEINNGFTNR